MERVRPWRKDTVFTLARRQRPRNGANSAIIYIIVVQLVCRVGCLEPHTRAVNSFKTLDLTLSVYTVDDSVGRHLRYCKGLSCVINLPSWDRSQ